MRAPGRDTRQSTLLLIHHSPLLSVANHGLIPMLYTSLIVVLHTTISPTHNVFLSLFLRMLVGSFGLFFHIYECAAVQQL